MLLSRVRRRALRTAFPSSLVLLTLVAVLGCAVASSARASEPGLGFADLMKVRKVHDPVVAADGSWIALEARPGRGDGEVIARATRGRGEHRIERGRSPVVAADGAFVAALRLAPFVEREMNDDEDAEKPLPGAVLLRTRDGERWEFDRVKTHGFSEDGAWWAVHFEAPAEADEDSTAETSSDEAPAEEGSDDESASEKEREPGTRLLLVRLDDLARFEIEDVDRWAFDPSGRWIAVAIASPDGEGDRLELRALDRDLETVVVAAQVASRFPALVWSDDESKLAFLQGDESEPGEIDDVRLLVCEAAATPSSRAFEVEEGWELPTENELRFTRDGERLFVGLRPDDSTDDSTSEPDGEGETAADSASGDDATESDEAPAPDPYDFDTILADRGVDVWHWNDPRIKSHAKASWKEDQKHLFRAVVHLDAGTLVRLADEELDTVAPVENPSVALGRSALPWLELVTWDGFYQDVYVVSLEDGARTLVVEKTSDDVELSPQGGYVAYYRPDDGGTWWLYDVDAGEHRRLRADRGFADEDHDYPAPAPGYGVAGWTTDDRTLFVYDKFDLWSFDTASGEGECVTAGDGRSHQRQYRIEDLDPEIEGIEPGSTLLLRGYDHRDKNSSFWSLDLADGELRSLREADKLFRVVAKAEDADVLIYTEERYDEFPDLWAADTSLRGARKLTDVNPMLRDFDLGEAELVRWTSADGIPLDGVLIKPAGYEPGRRYPVLVYYYRFFSQRLHEFNDPQINHRPSFYVYAGDGYAVFLPDIRFEVGRPGPSATACLVPGVQALVDMGVADPDAVALHGHSWSGYQTAFVVTQTDRFACAVAGAPVSNMFSAYGGIRYGTGLARQFQYEMSQSRIGASPWERRDLYEENSPLFFADRIDTPLLIQFGDVDEAVPWTQGIELYLAMRRLDKPSVMLQYRDEPHHLQKYANKLDYSLKMKEFIDHFCKGTPAPTWWTEGVPYSGD